MRSDCMYWLGAIRTQYFRMRPLLTHNPEDLLSHANRPGKIYTGNWPRRTLHLGPYRNRLIFVEDGKQVVPGLGHLRKDADGYTWAATPMDLGSSNAPDPTRPGFAEGPTSW
jgi:hypothetical protein